MLTKKFYARNDTTKNPDIQEKKRNKRNNKYIDRYEMSNSCGSIFEKDYWVSKVKIIKNVVGDIFIV